MLGNLFRIAPLVKWLWAVCVLLPVIALLRLDFLLGVEAVSNPEHEQKTANCGAAAPGKGKLDCSNSFTSCPPCSSVTSALFLYVGVLAVHAF